MTTQSSLEHTKELLESRSKLEGEIRALESQLKEHGVSTTEALVDSEGFPRADIDIVSIRQIRTELIYKQNDLKALMGEIEKALVALHSDTKSEEGSVLSEYARPFARINAVSPNSPASQAGLLVGDKVISYGSVNACNNDNLKQLVAETSRHIGDTIEVRVERVLNAKPTTVTIKLSPRNDWGGAGSLGCHILPL